MQREKLTEILKGAMSGLFPKSTVINTAPIMADRLLEYAKSYRREALKNFFEADRTQAVSVHMTNEQYLKLSENEKQVCDLCRDWSLCDCENCQLMKGCD